MNKIFIFVGLFAVCNAASLHVTPAGHTIYHQPAVVRAAYAPAYAPAFSSVVRSVDLSSDAVAVESPSVALAAAPAVISSVIPSALATTVSDAELADFEAYKEKFGKFYPSPTEDRYRRNLYFASKTRIGTHNELFNHGLAAEPLQIDIFSDQTRDEIFSLRQILDENQDEWNDYKLKYGKLYDTFEDRFRKTVYFIRKDTFADRNLLFEQGLSSYAQAIDNYTDYFDDELPSGSPAAVQRVAAAPVIHSRAFVPSIVQYQHPVHYVRASYPSAWQRAYFY